MKTLATIALTLAITAASSASYAGDNRCLGTVTNQPGWRPASLPVVVMIIDDQDEEVCRFDPTSKVGQQILRKCPRGSTCEIALPLPRNGDVSTLPKVQFIKKVERIERWEYSAMPAAAPPAPPPLTATAPPRSPALAKDKVRVAVTTEQQPTGKWCETESDDNLAPDIWSIFKRGNCKTGDDEAGWIEFFPGGYREQDTVCRITNQRRGKNWLLYQCAVESEAQSRLHKWTIDPKTRVLAWGTIDDEEDDRD